MAKLQTNQSGFSALEIILIITIVGILGSVGWYVSQARNKTNKSLNTNTSIAPTKAKTVATPTAALPLPDGWVSYAGDGFKFGYPGAYGQFTGRSTTQVAGGIQAVLASGQPNKEPFPGLATYGMFVLGNYGATNATIQSRKYGPTIKLENGKWIVTEANPSDPKAYKIGDVYNELKTTKQSTTTVYTFTSGDEGNVIETLAFIAKGHLYTLQLPGFDTGTYASQTANDQQPYDKLSSDLATHIIVQ